MNIYIADRQDITRAGLFYVISKIPDTTCKYTPDKAELVDALKTDGRAVVMVDYTLFDINDASELLILSERFSEAQWIIFSEDLSTDFVRTVIAASQRISIVLKESPLPEIQEAVNFAIRGRRYICQRMTEMLLTPDSAREERVKLTKTETEILKDIALGMTTREIAEKRFSSFHTVNTHRKNIFRKLGVNNVHEATKYALRAGLVNEAEYYI